MWVLHWCIKLDLTKIRAAPYCFVHSVYVTIHISKPDVKTESEQNKQRALRPWLSAQLCRTQCARDMEGSNDCNPLQSTGFPSQLAREASPPPICFLARIYQTQTERQTVWICRVNCDAPLASVQFMHRGYLQQRGRSSQEHVVTRVIWLVKTCFNFFLSDLDQIFLFKLPLRWSDFCCIHNIIWVKWKESL